MAILLAMKPSQYNVYFFGATPSNSEIPNLYNVQDILSDSAFDDFIPTLTDNTKDQNNI